MRRAVKRHLTRLGLLAGLTLACTGPGRGADDPLDDRVYGPAEKVEGKTCAEWTARWFEWGHKIPKARNPMTDKDGKFAAEGQNGPVWFLGGNLGGKTVRKFEVPAGKPILTPVVWALTTSRDAARQRADQIRDPEVTLDGKPVTGVMRHRVATGPVLLPLPKKQEEAVVPFLQGMTVFTDGYWLILKPLGPGRHALRIKARVGTGDEAYEQDITSHITVKEK